MAPPVAFPCGALTKLVHEMTGMFEASKAFTPHVGGGEPQAAAERGKYKSKGKPKGKGK